METATADYSTEEELNKEAPGLRSESTLVSNEITGGFYYFAVDQPRP